MSKNSMIITAQGQVLHRTLGSEPPIWYTSFDLFYCSLISVPYLTVVGSIVTMICVASHKNKGNINMIGRGVAMAKGYHRKMHKNYSC
mmetsp:Transcript_18443/g.37078  ORF Transcript_18443/g.37078 Transcript_18443/m.37078 type:complete len:88 (+) Transcript_18443:540-803(+)